MEIFFLYALFSICPFFLYALLFYFYIFLYAPFLYLTIFFILSFFFQRYDTNTIYFTSCFFFLFLSINIKFHIFRFILLILMAFQLIFFYFKKTQAQVQPPSVFQLLLHPPRQLLWNWSFHRDDRASCSATLVPSNTNIGNVQLVQPVQEHICL